MKKHADKNVFCQIHATGPSAHYTLIKNLAHCLLLHCALPNFVRFLSLAFLTNGDAWRQGELRWLGHGKIKWEGYWETQYTRKSIRGIRVEFESGAFVLHCLSLVIPINFGVFESSISHVLILFWNKIAFNWLGAYFECRQWK